MSIDDATPAEWDAASKHTYTRTKILEILQETLNERQWRHCAICLPCLMANPTPSCTSSLVNWVSSLNSSSKIREVLK